MDGTFLGPRARFLTSAMNAYTRALAAGLYVIPTTGRSSFGVRLAKEAAKEVGEDFNLYPGIYLNGATIYGKNGEPCQVIDFPNDLAHKLVQCIADINAKETSIPQWDKRPEIQDAPHIHGVPPMGEDRSLRNVFVTLAAYCLDGPLRTGDPPNRLADGMKLFQEGEIQPVDDWQELLGNYRVAKFLVIFHSEESAKRYRRLIKDTVLPDYMDITSAIGRVLEICPAGVEKEAALRRLGEDLKFNMEQVIAIGDGENDISMINQAAIGVAMDNGVWALKRKASYITETVENHGWANAVNAIVDAVLRAREE